MFLRSACCAKHDAVLRHNEAANGMAVRRSGCYRGGTGRHGNAASLPRQFRRLEFKLTRPGRRGKRQHLFQNTLF